MLRYKNYYELYALRGGTVYEAKVNLKQVGVVLSSKQVEYKPKRFKDLVLYDFGDINFKLTAKGVLILDKDETYQDKDVLINGVKVASGRNLEGQIRHTGLKAQPVVDEDTIVLSYCLEGDLQIENIYYEPDTKEIVIKTE